MSQWQRTETGDMYFPPTGEGAEAVTSDPLECAAIKIPAVLSFVLGEWAFDTSLGFPWPAIWAQKNPSIVAIKQLIRKTVLGVPLTVPVARVDDVAAAYSASLRDFRYGLLARLANGAQVSL